jgi:hypothetical protein
MNGQPEKRKRRKRDPEESQTAQAIGSSGLRGVSLHESQESIRAHRMQLEAKRRNHAQHGRELRVAVWR